MGVDLRLAFTTGKKIEKEEMRDITYRLAEAVGHDFFYLGKGREDGTLAFAEKDYLNGTYRGYNNNAPIYEYEGLSRYYGDGYERGYFPSIYMTIIWLRYNLPNVTIFYGSDSTELIDVLELDEQEELLKHWCQWGGRPYRDRGNLFKKMCLLCHKEMTQFGYGGNYAALNCLGCGWKQITRDNGESWSEKDPRED